jgi:hypothetical protein
MRLSEFKNKMFQVLNQKFIPTAFEPLDYGIQRAAFEEQKLQQLISLAEQVEFLTAKNKLRGWRRQLERATARRLRLENTKKGLYPNRYSEPAVAAKEDETNFSLPEKLPVEAKTKVAIAPLAPATFSCSSWFSKTPGF